MDLKQELAAIPSPFPGHEDPWDFFKQPILPALAELSDAELRKLLALVEAEGLRREFGNYWWE